MGIPTLIKTLTASGSEYLDFVDGTDDVVFDSTYDEYMFVFTDINPVTDAAEFQFQVNSTNDAGGDWDVSLITSTFFKAHHGEDTVTDETDLSYHTSHDQAQAAGFQTLAYDVGNDADQSVAGIMHLFSPSSTTYVKHFYSRVQNAYSSDISMDTFVAGYINDASYAIDEIRFKFSAGAFDGVIQMYGIA